MLGDAVDEARVLQQDIPQRLRTVEGGPVGQLTGGVDGILRLWHRDQREARLRLMTDQIFYGYKQERCARIQEPFYDQRTDWNTSLAEMLAAYAYQCAAVSHRVTVNHT